MGGDTALYTTLYATSIFAAASSLALIWKWRQDGRLPSPPGPKGYPLVGNIFDLRHDVPTCEAFMSLAEQYDTDILHLKMMTTDFVVLSSAQAISDLVEKRSNVYADRPSNSMLELMGAFTWNIGALKYGSQWRNNRRLMHEFMNTRALSKFDEQQRKYACRFLSRLAETPGAFPDHAKFLTGALIMDITYGMDIKSHKNQYLQAAERAMQFMERALVPGAFLVDAIPILKYVPEWFPGAGFQTFAREARGHFDLAVDGPLAYVKRSLESEPNNASIVSTGLARVAELADQGFDESIVRNVASSMYIAATDTTTTILTSFFLAMALHPEVVRKAQEEIDSVVGTERLPDFSDWDKLPYVSALLKELLRWNCPVPLGVPKRAMEDDVYRGYFIPAGATVVENIWAVCYNKTIYPSPETYSPERFLKDGQLDLSLGDPADRIFGFGRRICPGKDFALRTIFINIAFILAVFDIEAPAGQKIEPKFHVAAVRHTLPFKCVIKPRSEAKLRLMKNACTSMNP